MPLEEPSYESTPQVSSARSTFSIRALMNSGACPAFMLVELSQDCRGACGIGDAGSLAVPQPHRRVLRMVTTVLCAVKAVEINLPDGEATQDVSRHLRPIC